MKLYKTIKSHRTHWQFQSSMFLVLCILVSNIWLIDTIFTMLIFHQGTVTPPEMGKLGPLILRCFHILYSIIYTGQSNNAKTHVMWRFPGRISIGTFPREYMLWPVYVHLGRIWPPERISKRIVDRAIEITMMAVRMGLMFILFFTLLRYDIGKFEFQQTYRVWYEIWGHLFDNEPGRI